MVRGQECPNPIRWEMVLKKLHRYALGRAGIPKGRSQLLHPEYIIGDACSSLELVALTVEEVVGKVLRNEVEFERDIQLTEAYVLNILKKVFRERLVDLRRRIEARKTDYAEEMKLTSDDGRDVADFFDSYQTKKVSSLKQHQILSDPLPAPDECDEEANERSQLEEIYERVKGDRELEEMVEAICGKEDLRRPRDIAVYLNTSVEDIYNRIKRLRTRFNYLRPQQQRKAV